MMYGQEKSDNEIHLLIKYIKSVLCRVAKGLSYIQDARCLKVKVMAYSHVYAIIIILTDFLLFLFSNQYRRLE